MEGNKPIQFTPGKNPIFREKHEPKIEVHETAFSPEKENTENTNGEKGEKYFALINKDNQEEIGRLYYDYPKQDSTDAVF